MARLPALYAGLFFVIGEAAASPAHAISAPPMPLLFLAAEGHREGPKYVTRFSGMRVSFGEARIVFHTDATRVDVSFPGANPASTPEGVQPVEARANFLRGDHPERWAHGVCLYGGILYRGLYPGIDMLYSGSGARLKSEFVVSPGADPSLIRMRYGGIKSLHVDKAGTLVISTASGTLREGQVEIYQERNGRRVMVEGTFKIYGRRDAGFEVGRYDPSRALIIDPVLSASTRLGGSGMDVVTAVSTGRDGGYYVAGWSDSTDFTGPGTSTIRRGRGTDAFVAKFNAQGKGLAYLTFLGGSADDRATGLSVDQDGSAHVAGWTTSPNFPLALPAQARLLGSRNVFVAKLSAAGDTLLYSSYLGGSGADTGNSIALDSYGNAYVAGDTTSPDFPLLGAVQSSRAGALEAFITKFNPAGALVFSTYLGGKGEDRATAVAVDPSGNAVVTGGTYSPDFPVRNPVQASNGGGQDAFIAKLSGAGSTLLFSTYLGGTGGGSAYPEQGTAIALDAAGNVYVAGTAASPGLASGVTQHPYGGGATDGFVAKLDAAGSHLVYLTFLGGTSLDYAQAIAVNGTGRVSVAGYTASTDFPVQNPLQAELAGLYDAFLVTLSETGQEIFGTYLGGNDSDSANAVAVDAANTVYLGGQTLSTDFPTVSSVGYPSQTGRLDGFLAVLTAGSAPRAVSLSPESGNGTSQTFSAVFSDDDGAADLQWVEVLFNSSLSAAHACYLHYQHANRQVWMMRDDGSGWMASVTLGSQGKLENNQCSLDASTSTASESGNELLFRPAITFMPAFGGSRLAYLYAADAADRRSNFSLAGRWTVPAGNQPPQAVSITPSSGFGARQTFTMLFSDADGAAGLRWVEALFSSALNPVAACYVHYERAAKQLWLLRDDVSGWVGPLSPGAQGTLENSQCSVNTAASSETESGKNLSLALAVDFKVAFGGPRLAYLYAADDGDLRSGFTLAGSWTVPGTNHAPQAVSVAPASGSGTRQTFSAVFTDAASASDILWAEVLFNSGLTPSQGCYLHFEHATGRLWLLRDDATTWTGPVTLGSAGTLSNGQCRVDAATSSWEDPGSNMTINLAIEFTSAFTGPRLTYLYAADRIGLRSGFILAGSWTVPGDTHPPQAVSLTPNSGTGTSQTFQAVFSDAGGAADLRWAEILFNSGLRAAGGCYTHYDRASGQIWLMRDDASGWLPPLTLGGAGTLQNSQCRVNAAASSAIESGNKMTLNLRVDFTGAFAGQRAAYLYAADSADLRTDFTVAGAWTVP